MKLPEEGFRFNCGFDRCTFPIQYCDTEEDRCSYCSSDVCQSGSIPEQCTTECNSLLSTTTQTTTESIQMSTTALYHDNALVGVYIIAIAALLLVLLVIAWILRRKILFRKNKNNRTIDYTPMAATTIVVQQDEAAKTTGGEDGTVQFPNNTENGHQPQPTAPLADSQDSIRSHSDSTIVTHPDDENQTTSHNFGNHSIMPSTMDGQPSNSSFSHDHSREPPSTGPFSQAENDKNCEKPNHEILKDSKYFTNNKTDDKPYINEIGNMNTCTGSLGLDINKNETRAKEGPLRTDKVC